MGLVAVRVYACPPYPGPNPGPHPPLELFQDPQACLCLQSPPFSLPSTVSRCSQGETSPGTSPHQPQGAEAVLGAQGASHAASATACLLSPLCHVSFLPSAQEWRRRGGVAQGHVQVTQDRPLAPEQHWGPSLVGVGHGACCATQVAPPRPPGFKHMGEWGLDIREQRRVPSQGHMSP